MNSETIMRELKQNIAIATVDMDRETYTWFMHELSEWCEYRADVLDIEDELLNCDE